MNTSILETLWLTMAAGAAASPNPFRRCYGSEFVAKAVQDWIGAVGAKTAYIEPGSPWKNGYCESFNSKLRDELLDGEIFYTLEEARVIIENWRRASDASARSCPAFAGGRARRTHDPFRVCPTIQPGQPRNRKDHSTCGRGLVKPPRQRRALPSSSKRAPLKAAIVVARVSLECWCSSLHSGETDYDQSTAYAPNAVLVAIDIAKVRNEVLIEAPLQRRRQ